MNFQTDHSYHDICLGAALGAVATVAVGLLMMGRQHRIPGYLHQSGEGAGTTESSIQQHDEEMFRDEIARANS